MPDGDVTAKERLERLASEHLADYPRRDALNALIDIDDSTPLPVPDDVLVRAARRLLEEIGVGGEQLGPAEILREVAREDPG